MATRLITGPAAEPITLDEAKNHLRVDFSDDDDLISAIITAARVYCEQWTQRAFVTQTWELVIDSFPGSGVRTSTSSVPTFSSSSGEILLPFPPLQSVVSVKYDDAAGNEQTLGALDYDVDNVSQPGWVVPSSSGWPGSIWPGINSVRVRYVAGYLPGTNSPIDLAANVPGVIKSAMKLYIGQLYDQREDIAVGTIANKLPSGNLDYLLRQYRVALGMA
jgi:uncharacterized phiE125 gp8 family phage protein